RHRAAPGRALPPSRLHAARGRRQPAGGRVGGGGVHARGVPDGAARAPPPDGGAGRDRRRPGRGRGHGRAHRRVGGGAARGRPGGGALTVVTVLIVALLLALNALFVAAE